MWQESPPQNSPKLSYKPFIKCILYDICMICISHITKNKHHAQSQFSGFSYYDFSSTNHHVFQKMMNISGSTFEDLSDRSTFSSRFRFFSLGSFPMTFGEGLVVGKIYRNHEEKNPKMGGSTVFNRNFCSIIFVKPIQ